MILSPWKGETLSTLFELCKAPRLIILQFLSPPRMYENDEPADAARGHTWNAPILLNKNAQKCQYQFSQRRLHLWEHENLHHWAINFDAVQQCSRCVSESEGAAAAKCVISLMLFANRARIVCAALLHAINCQTHAHAPHAYFSKCSHPCWWQRPSLLLVGFSIRAEEPIMVVIWQKISTLDANGAERQEIGKMQFGLGELMKLIDYKATKGAWIYNFVRF